MRIFTDEEKTIIDTMYKSGEKIDDIRFYLHCKEGTLRNYLKENGYVKRKRNTVNGKERLKASRKHYFNEKYFEEIDTEDKAYWLGFLYADGNVSYGKDQYGNKKGCTVELTLAEQDKNHLYKFLKCLDADNNYPLKKRIVKLNEKEFISYRLSLNSVVLGNDLENLGCIPHKSLILRRPNIAKHLIRHFVRGYFDGDGCVSFNRELGNSIYTILGTKDILSFIKSESGISNKISIRQVKRNNEYKQFYEFSISGIKSKIIFHNYIYKDANIFLDRKFEKSWDIYNYLTKNRMIKFINPESQTNDSLLLCSNE